MRYAVDHKARTRETLLTVAGRALRRAGPQGVGVAGVMAEAGLTHGGFYAHFKSKDDLVAAAVGAMFDDGRRRHAKVIEGKAPCEALGAYIDFYLSPSHRDSRDRGCPLPAMNGDIARLPDAARAQFGVGVAGLTERVEALLSAVGQAGLGVSVVSEMVGALGLARAVADAAQSDAILDASRATLKRRLGLETAR